MRASSSSRSGSDKERIESKHAHTLTAVAANTPAVADRLTLLIRNPVIGNLFPSLGAEEQKADGCAYDSHRQSPGQHLVEELPCLDMGGRCRYAECSDG